MPTSHSFNAVPSRPSETRSTGSHTSAARRVFDTMENTFFKEGEELSRPVSFDNGDDDEVTELVPRPKSKRNLVIGIAVAVMALAGLAVLIF